MRVEIGKVCYKGGGHPAYHGDDDFGACGSKYYATIYVEVEEDYPNPRGEHYTSEDAARDIQLLVREAALRGWDQ